MSVKRPTETLSPTAGDLLRIESFPRVSLGSWPTPIERIPAFSEPEVLVKRDDLCEFGRGGAKARKIESVIGHLLERGHNELIAVAGNVTNLAFDLLLALDRFAIGGRLYIADDPPMAPADRERAFRGIRRRIVLAGGRPSEIVTRALLAYTQSRARGRRPFLILPGFSHPAALIGNACGFIEMARQLRSEGRRLPATVFVSAATGTTLGGFLLGEHVLRRAGYSPIRVVGVQVYPGPVERWTLLLVRWTERFLGLQSQLPARRIRIDRSMLCGGFGHFDSELEGLCSRVRAQTGLRIDPIFGGKTWWVMERHRERAALYPGVGAAERRILYWHCGFTPEWRELGDAIGREPRRRRAA